MRATLRRGRVCVAYLARPVGVFSSLMFVLVAPAQAHHPGIGGGSGSGGPINTISAGTLDEGQIAAAVRYEFIRLGQLSDAGLLAAASQGNHAHSMRSIESASLSVAYGVTNNFTVSVRLPGVRRSGIREAARVRGHAERRPHERNGRHEHERLDEPQWHHRARQLLGLQRRHPARAVSLPPERGDRPRGRGAVRLQGADRQHPRARQPRPICSKPNSSRALAHSTGSSAPRSPSASAAGRSTRADSTC